MLLGLVRPSGGTARVLGHGLDDLAAYLPDIGALIESPAAYRSLSARENLRVLATVAGRGADRIDDVLELVGLSDRADDAVKGYSLGMRQRLGIAGALLGDPRLVILDEPSNGLDPEGRREVRELIGRLRADGRTVLVSSHDLAELEQVCDWLILIDTGRVLYQGPASELLETRPDELVARVARDDGDEVGLTPLADRLRQLGRRVEIDGATMSVPLHATDELDELAATVNRLAFEVGVVLVELRPNRSTLEERYLALVERGQR